MAKQGELFRLHSPLCQNFLASVIVALGPGVYGAITILGAGGGQPSAARMANIANSVLYAIYFVLGLVSGSIVTTIGPKFTFLLGTLGYPFFVGSLWYFDVYGNLWFPILGGAVLGFCAALLWTAAGYIAFSYAEEKDKGKYIAMQWGLLSVGSTIASFVAFGINFGATEAKVPIAVYIVFICLMASSFLVALFGIVQPETVRRADESPLAKYPHDGFMIELKAQGRLLTDWRVLLLLLPFFASEVAIIIMSNLNSLYFNIRTRSLNSVMFTIMQFVGAVFISWLLDNQHIGNRKRRALVSTAVMGTIIIAGWAGLTGWLYKHPYDPLNLTNWDWTDSEFGPFCVLNLIFGANMVIYQVVVQWIVASLSNDPQTLARYAGIAKGTLAGGLAASFGTEASGLSQFNVVAFNFTIQAVGIVCMFLTALKAVKETNYYEEENVVVPGARLTEDSIKGEELHTAKAAQATHTKAEEGLDLKYG